MNTLFSDLFENFDVKNLYSIFPINIFWQDVSGRYLGCNAQMLRLLGLSSQKDFIGKTIHDFLEKEQAEVLKKIDSQVVMLDQEFILIEKGKDKDGNQISYLTQKIPMHDEEGTLTGIIGVSLDLSFQRKYSQFLRQERQDAEVKIAQVNVYLDNILENIPGNIYWMDREGHILGCNESQAKAIGLKNSHELMGKNSFDVAKILHWNEEIPIAIRQNDLEVMETGQTKIIEETVILNEGKRTYLASKNPLRNKSGEVIGIIGIGTDITERKRAEEREKEALEKASAEKAKAETEEYIRRIVTVLAGSIVHDLRTPLATVVMAASGIQQLLPVLVDAYRTVQEAGLPLTRKLQPFQLNQLSHLGNSIKKSIDETNLFITETLKMLSRIVSNDVSTEDFVNCSLRDCVCNALDAYPFEPGERESVEWDPQATFYFLGNPILFSRVFYNLINNALYQIRKKKKGKIYLSVSEQSQFNVFKFKDTAGGVSEEVLKTLFEDYRSTKENGTGVGLASCKIIMHSFGGDISARVEANESIEFLLFFPKSEKNNVEI